MKQIRWFDRKFDFSSEQNTFPSILERISDTPLRLEHKINQIAPSLYTHKTDDGAWSIQENVGHLIDLEPLWQGRVEDILSGQQHMRPADLDNTATHRAQHNLRSMNDLLSEFWQVREATLKKLENLSDQDVFRYALHPRLNTPMRIMDLFLFVAEHDDHHLAQMTALHKSLSK